MNGKSGKPYEECIDGVTFTTFENWDISKDHSTYNRIILCCKENDPGYVFLVFHEKCDPLKTSLKEHMILFCILIHSVMQMHIY